MGKMEDYSWIIPGLEGFWEAACSADDPEVNLVSQTPETPESPVTEMVVSGVSSGGVVRVQRGWSEESGYRSLPESGNQNDVYRTLGLPHSPEDYGSLDDLTSPSEGYRSLREATSPSADSEVSLTELGNMILSSDTLVGTPSLVLGQEMDRFVKSGSSKGGKEEDGSQEEEEDEMVLVPSGK